MNSVWLKINSAHIFIFLSKLDFRCLAKKNVTIYHVFIDYVSWLNYMEQQTKDSHWMKAIMSVSDWPRKEAVTGFHMATGHDCLTKHLHRFGIFHSPICMLCNQDRIMDSQHLAACPALSRPTLIDRYWEAREMMNSLSN